MALAESIALGSALASGAAGLGRLLYPSDRRYDAQLEAKLRALQNLPSEVTISPEKEAMMENVLMNPIRTRAAQQRSRDEAMLASQGITSGAHQAAIRQGRAETIGDAIMKARSRMFGEIEADKERQRQALRQRQIDIDTIQAGIEERKWQAKERTLRGLAQTGQGIGMAAGVSPGTYQASGLFGTMNRAQREASAQTSAVMQAAGGDPKLAMESLGRIASTPGELSKGERVLRAYLPDPVSSELSIAGAYPGTVRPRLPAAQPTLVNEFGLPVSRPAPKLASGVGVGVPTPGGAPWWQVPGYGAGYPRLGEAYAPFSAPRNPWDEQLVGLY